MKYLSQKKTLLLLALSFFVLGGIYFLPIILENMLLQKIVTISYLVVGTALAVLFFLVNGASTAIVDGEYEKSFYKTVKDGTAATEGENLHWNPLKLSLVKRIYYSKLILCFLSKLLEDLGIECVLGVFLLFEVENYDAIIFVLAGSGDNALKVVKTVESESDFFINYHYFVVIVLKSLFCLLGISVRSAEAGCETREHHNENECKCCESKYIFHF